MFSSASRGCGPAVACLLPVPVSAPQLPTPPPPPCVHSRSLESVALYAMFSTFTEPPFSRDPNLTQMHFSSEVHALLRNTRSNTKVYSFQILPLSLPAPLEVATALIS